MNQLERAVARMFCIGFDGTRIPAEADALLKRGVGSAALFRRNVTGPAEFADLCAQLKSRAARPFIIGIDQEGGRVMRLRGQFTDVPSMRELGRTGDAGLAEQVGRVLAVESRAMNVDVVFAPVLDVDTNPKNPVIADRSLGQDPKLVGVLGAALVRGIQSAGVAACGKHFPGHGDTWQDSHHTLPALDHDAARMDEIELPPFIAGIRAGVAMIMTAHVVYRPIDSKYPATMSSTILDGLLRKRLGFDGVLISDDMEMKAIAANYGLEDAIIRGTNAGVNLFAICHSHDQQNQAIDLLVRAVERGAVPRERIDESNRRLDVLCDRFVRSPAASADLKVVGCADHQAIVERVRALAGRQMPAAVDPTENWKP